MSTMQQTIKDEVEDMEVVLSPKYQIVVPKEVRENLVVSLMIPILQKLIQE
ncbi:unnamed protein product [marine sediment metagenome]|uniref:Uncharacterized protein n=1 Tax=marine sediment metagenome TaxID=412755 RepID=X0WAV8_9ZZZZ